MVDGLLLCLCHRDRGYHTLTCWGVVLQLTGMQVKHTPHLHQELATGYEGVAFVTKCAEAHTYNSSGIYWTSPHMYWFILQYSLYYSRTTNIHHSCLFFTKVAAENWKGI